MVAVKFSNRSACDYQLESCENPQEEGSLLSFLHEGRTDDHALVNGKQYIIKHWGTGSTSQHYFTCLEYCPGGELYNRVKDRDVNLHQARKYFFQLTQALAHCHTRGVFHMDISLENILLDGSDDVKLVDFGLALSKGQSMNRGRRGKNAYMAPEVRAIHVSMQYICILGL